MLTLTIVTHNFYVAAIKKTLNYIHEECTYALGDELSLIVEDDDETITLKGFLPIFIYCSRKAHTFPKDALEAAICLQSLQLAEYANFETLENMLKNKTWFDDRYEMSTCVDFFLISRLSYANQENNLLSNFPNIQQYIKLEPDCDEYIGYSDDEESDKGKVSSHYCIIA